MSRTKGRCRHQHGCRACRSSRGGATCSVLTSAQISACSLWCKGSRLGCRAAHAAGQPRASDIDGQPAMHATTAVPPHVCARAAGQGSRAPLTLKGSQPCMQPLPSLHACVCRRAAG